MTMLSDAEWTVGAELFGVPPDELRHYQQAFADLEAMGLPAYADSLEAELVTAVTAGHAAGSVPAGIVCRLEIRKTVLVEAMAWSLTDGLATYDGPRH